MKKSELKKLIKESMEGESVINAYEKAYEEETGYPFKAKSFEFDDYTEEKQITQKLKFQNLSVDGEDLGNVTIMNKGKGWFIAY